MTFCVKVWKNEHFFIQVNIIYKCTKKTAISYYKKMTKNLYLTLVYSGHNTTMSPRMQAQVETTFFSHSQGHDKSTLYHDTHTAFS